MNEWTVGPLQAQSHDTYALKWPFQYSISKLTVVLMQLRSNKDSLKIEYVGGGGLFLLHTCSLIRLGGCADDVDDDSGT